MSPFSKKLPLFEGVRYLEMSVKECFTYYKDRIVELLTFTAITKFRVTAASRRLFRIIRACVFEDQSTTSRYLYKREFLGEKKELLFYEMIEI